MNKIKSEKQKPLFNAAQTNKAMWMNLQLGAALPVCCLLRFILDYTDYVKLAVSIVALGLNVGLLCVIRFKGTDELERLITAVIGMVSLCPAAALTAAFTLLSGHGGKSEMSSAITLGICALAYACISFQYYKARRKVKDTD